MRCVQCLLFIPIVATYLRVYIQNPQMNECVCQTSLDPCNSAQIDDNLHTLCVKRSLLHAEEPRVKVCVTLSEGFHPLTSFGSDGKAVSVRLGVHAPVFIFSSP